MTEQEAKKRFAQGRVARLATTDPDGNPHLVPICFAVQEDTIYSAVDAKPKTTRDLTRLRNIGANPNVTLLVDHYDDEWDQVWWVRADGTATVHDTHERGKQALTEKYPQYQNAPENLGRIVAVDVNKWTSWAFRDPV